MTIEQAILEKVRVLSPEKQQEILDFTEFLYQKFHKDDSKQSLPELDPIWGLGSNPIQLDINDAAENHDLYIYGYES
jgi:hypothetical protein